MLVPMLSVTLLLEINMPSQAFSYSIEIQIANFLSNDSVLDHIREHSGVSDRCLSERLLLIENSRKLEMDDDSIPIDKMPRRLSFDGIILL